MPPTEIFEALFGGYLALGLVAAVFVTFCDVRKAMIEERGWSNIRASLLAALNIACLAGAPFVLLDLLKNDAAAAAIRFVAVALVCLVGFVGGSFLCLVAFLSAGRGGWMREPAQGPQEETSTMAAAKETTVPLIATIVLLIASAMGAYAGGGGTVEGCSLAFFLNPLAWVAATCFEWIGTQRCGHCRRLLGTIYGNSPVGSPMWCRRCGNYSRKI